MIFRGIPPSEAAMAEGGRGVSVPISGGDLRQAIGARIGQTTLAFAMFCFGAGPMRKCAFVGLNGGSVI
ncbi:hypothetical protein M2341_002010 [Sphingobium sp. B7D2B]|nr:hypothetical protein [Sphingobium sp. B7D2B]